jgi:peptidoglycan-associated lipoprotein
MKNRVWIHLVMAVLVAGLFLTVSCAKKTVVSDATTIEDQGKTGTGTDTGTSASGTDTGADADAIAQQKLDEQMANEKALKEARTMAARKRFVNQDIHFEFDSSELSSMAKMILKEKAVWLKANYSEAVTIEGHCDERGTTEYNLALGERRAGAAKAYLTNLGVSATRLNTISYGEEQPLDAGKTEDAYRKNRRAHFAVE